MPDPPLVGFGIRGFRSFSWGEVQHLGPLSRVHLLAGPNGAGKSNLLRAMLRVLPALRADAAPRLDPRLDEPNADAAGEPGEDDRLQAAVAIALTEERAAAAGLLYPRVPFDTLRAVLGGPSFTGADIDASTLCWFEFEAPAQESGIGWVSTARQRGDLIAATKAIGDRDLLGGLALQYAGNRGDENDSARFVLEHLVDALGVRSDLPDATMVAPLRRINDAPLINGEPAPHSYPEEIARLILPGIDNPGARDRVEAMNDLVAYVLDEPSFRLEPQWRRNHDGADDDRLFVSLDGRPVRPLESHGSGVEQLVVLAYEATVPGKALILIEEPEVHLHPAMQRRLLDSLLGDETKQYIVATHSPHLLDAARASITSVATSDRWSRLKPAVRPDEVARVSMELGTRASDLLQTNAVVWVEGPSDRIYVRHWLRHVEPRLVEGVHYSLVWYGGTLLRWLSADDTTADDLIPLPRLNRNFAVVLDSDRRAAADDLGSAKQRMVDLLMASPLEPLIWVTDGYTIENYLRVDELAAAVEAVHRGARFAWNGDPFVNPLARPQIDRERPDKVAIAAALTIQAGDEPGWRVDLDVEQRVETLAASLRRVNGLAEPA